ncbi:MAG: class I SAM-dependent methyltransferase [Planctomycetes bacterium]|nr:class I SAM-dependent methyltransferase [Planctomycetota bacterium]
MDFYDAIAGDYDAMTGAAAARAGAAEALADALIRRFGLHSALDAACGTGLHAIALARRGARVVGADLSAGMLEQARRRAQAQRVDVRWVCTPMQKLAAAVDGAFDAVLCLGNSLPHVLTDADLDATLAGFAARLAPSGAVVLHLLNYERVLATRERIVHVSRHGDREFIRFYDFDGPVLGFNLLELTWIDGACRHRLHSTPHRPWTAADLAAALARHGLGDVRTYGTLGFDPYDARDSQAAVIVARREG